MPQPVVGVILAGGRSSRMGREKPLLEIGGKPLIERVRDALAPAVSEILLVTNRPDLYGFLGLTVIPDLVPGRGPLAGIHAALTRLARGTALVVAADYPFLEPSALARIAKEAPGIARGEGEYLGTATRSGRGTALAGTLAPPEELPGGIRIGGEPGRAGPGPLTDPAGPLDPHSASAGRRIATEPAVVTRKRLTTTTPVPGARGVPVAKGIVVLPQIEGRLHPLCALYSVSSLDEVAASLAVGELMVLSLVARLEQKVLAQQEFGPDAARIFFNVNTPEDVRRAEEMLEKTQPRG